jgi:hypothetical protein
LIRGGALSMNRETPTVQSERGLSQTAARMLARALNLLRRVAWRSAASWDNSRSGAKAGSWPVSRSERNKELPMNPKMVRSGPDLNLSLFAARGRDVALRCPRRPAQRRAVATLAKFRNACAALRFGDGPAGRPYLTSALPMNRETPTLQSERGLSQTAARILARALNLPRRVGWRSAASWDNSRSGVKAGSWPVSRSKWNKQLSRQPDSVMGGVLLHQNWPAPALDEPNTL